MPREEMTLVRSRAAQREESEVGGPVRFRGFAERLFFRADTQGRYFPGEKNSPLNVVSSPR